MANLSWSGSSTTNTIPLSAQRVEADVVRYVNKVDTDSGWLLVGSDDFPRSQWKSLFKYCKVMLIGSKGSRTYFKVLEGESKGRILYLSDANADEYLGKKAPKQQPIELIVTYGRLDPSWLSKSRNKRFQQQLANGVLGGINFEVSMNTSWNGTFYPIPSGTYSILLPDFPHTKDYTNQYKAEYPRLSHHQVWFPIAYGNNSRYVHVGNVSEGCTTVLSLSSWSSIHEMLVSHRSADGNGVGILTVKGKPERNV
ncbi:hypothetical protein [Paraburkholderia hayleyella]|uniref:hypothetical protein n=1 Tax=Paraburkholderia hayleyella TaxID=2152889 RepID=UPI001291785A|nr:hypothetical protein [Paraburkholderia hayleyella]